MNKDDLVRITKSPSEQFACLVGRVGVVDDISNNMARVVAINLDGDATGMGNVPTESLSVEADPQWQKAAKSYFDRTEALRKIGENRIRRYNEHIKKVAEKHGLPVETIESILNDMSELSMD